MAIDAATQALIEAARRARSVPRHLLPPAEARAALKTMAAGFGRGSAACSVANLAIPVADGEIELRLVKPDSDPDGVIVYFHGGGWVVGDNDVYEPMARELADRSGFAVAMVCYRKAPEHRYPQPLDDAWTAFNWIAVRRQELFGAELPLVVAGDSAGGNLAAVITLREKAAGLQRIAAQVLLYPVTNADLDTPSFRAPDNQLLLPREAMEIYWCHYVPDMSRRMEPEAAPLLAADHGGLPPAIVVTAEHDVLRDEGEAYAAKLAAAGVPVIQRRFAGQVHGFVMMVGLLPGSDAALNFIAENLPGALSSRSGDPSDVRSG